MAKLNRNVKHSGKVYKKGSEVSEKEIVAIFKKKGFISKEEKKESK